MGPLLGADPAHHLLLEANNPYSSVPWISAGWTSRAGALELLELVEHPAFPLVRNRSRRANVALRSERRRSHGPAAGSL